MKIYSWFEQNKKKPIKEQLGCRYFLKIILVKAKYRIRTRYLQILNVKGLGSGLG